MPLNHLREEERKKFKLPPEEDRKKLSFLAKKKEEEMAEDAIDELKDNYTSLVGLYQAILQQIKEMNERLNEVMDKIATL